MAFAPATLRRWGNSLREIDPATLHSEPGEGSVRWFLGEEGTELFCWGDPSDVDHAQLVFGQATVEWSRSRGISTGRFAAAVAPLGGRYDPYLLQAHAGLDASACEAALVILEASAEVASAVPGFLSALRGVSRPAIEAP